MKIKLKFKKVELPCAIYMFLLCVYTGITVFASSNVQNILFVDKTYLYALIVKWVAPALVILFILERKVSKSKIIMMSILALVMVAVTFNSQNRGFSIMFAAILAFPKGLSSKTIAKWISYIIFSSTFIILIMYFMGIIAGDIISRGSVVRMSYGFTSPNAFGNTVLLWMLFYIYYKFHVWNFKNSIACTLITFIVFSITNSRMAFIMEVLILIVIHAWKIRKSDGHKPVYFLSTYIYPFFTIICYIITYIYSKGIFYPQLSILNILMSYRLGFMRNYLNEYGIKLFGQAIQTVSRAQQLITGEAWSGLDNSYMYILITWGIILTIILCFLYVILGYYLKNCGNYIGALCVLVFCIVGLTENYLSNISYNLAAILIAEMLSSSAIKRGSVIEGFRKSMVNNTTEHTLL